MTDLFLEPKTKQYGSHMIMTNVHKPTKIKYINIDTRFRDEYNSSQTANYNITLPERITNVKSMRVTNIEIPISYYNISANLGNNYFSITGSNNIPQIITIPDGNRTITSLITDISNAISSTNLISITTNLSGGTMFTAKSSPITLNFAVDDKGLPDKYNIKSKLGWILGFRNPSYKLAALASITSESLIDVNGPRYLYLAIDDFNKTNINSFVNPLFTSMISGTNVISRISLINNNAFQNGTSNYQTIYSANSNMGFMVTDRRHYNSKVDLFKLNVQLLNEMGVTMALNGWDFSFCLEIEYD